MRKWVAFSVIFLLFATLPLFAANLSIESLTISPSQKNISLPVLLNAGENIVGIQFTLRFNPNVLKFSGVSSGGNASSFNLLTNSGRGIVRVGGFDGSLKGISGGEIAVIQFEVIGGPGSRSYLNLSRVRLSNKKGKSIQATGGSGSVIIEGKKTTNNNNPKVDTSEREIPSSSTFSPTQSSPSSSRTSTLPTPAISPNDFSSPTYLLTVYSPYGNPSPGIGAFSVKVGERITCSVNSPVYLSDNVRAVCTGFKGTGSVPYSGSNSEVTFTMNSPSSITFFWEKEYKLTFSSNPSEGGSIELTPLLKWIKEGKEITLKSITNPGYRFVRWSNGDKNSNLTLRVSAPLSLTAFFKKQDDFVIMSKKKEITLSPGEKTKVILTLKYLGNFHSQVKLDLPTEIKGIELRLASQTLNSRLPETTLSISTSSFLKSGTYLIGITGNSKNLHRTCWLNLEILGGIEIPDITLKKGEEEVEITLLLKNISKVSAYKLRIIYPSEFLRYVETAFPENSFLQPDIEKEEGNILISGFCQPPFSGEKFLKLKFSIIKEIPEKGLRISLKNPILCDDKGNTFSLKIKNGRIAKSE